MDIERYQKLISFHYAPFIFIEIPLMLSSNHWTAKF